MSSDTLMVVGSGLIAIIAIVVALVATLRGKPVTPVVAPVEKKAADEAQKKIEAAEVKEVVDIQKAKDDHDEITENVVVGQKKEADKLGDDGKAVNDFLKDIGKKVQS